jgi:hypothetical protein
MTYLTYDEYLNVGGVLDSTAFNRNIDRACGLIDNATRNRIEDMKEVPQSAKVLCRELVEYLSQNVLSGSTVASKSQSAGAVSESVSYNVKTVDEMYGDIQNILYDYLGSEKDGFGTPLLYRGCMR